jgi:predicted ATP-binding protein involved in virulence
VPSSVFDAVAQAFKDLLLLDPNDELIRRRGKIEVEALGTRLRLYDLSDGFQSIMALCSDIMIAMSERWGDMREAEGIVLLDEIEVHLHPRWKIEIVERLRRVFPRVAFVVTTHDPLCLKGLHDGEITLLERTDEDHIVAQQGLPSVNHLRADQILTSPLFGLSTTRGTLARDSQQRYVELLSRPIRTEAEEREFEQLRATMSPTLVTGETPVQRQVEDALYTTLLSMNTGKRELAVSDKDSLSPEVRAEMKRQLSQLLG